MSHSEHSSKAEPAGFPGGSMGEVRKRGVKDFPPKKLDKESCLEWGKAIDRAELGETWRHSSEDLR